MRSKASSSGSVSQAGQRVPAAEFPLPHPLPATICTPTSRPVITGVRMRRGKAADSRGAPKFVSEALAVAVCRTVPVSRSSS
jgi:hypothetical protein